MITLLCRPRQQRQQPSAGDTERHVSLLLSRGLLTRHTASLGGYLFSMPNAGAAIRSVAGGQAVAAACLPARAPASASLAHC